MVRRNTRPLTMAVLGQTPTSSLEAARPLPPSADIDPGVQSVGQAAQFCLAAHAAAEDISSAPQLGCVCPREGNKELGLFDFRIELAFAPQREHGRPLPTDRDQVAAP